MSGSEFARICWNGHLVGNEFEPIGRPGLREHLRPFCERCGKPTTLVCPSCKSPIGKVARAYMVPAFCGDCGQPYPWTESKLQEAQKLIDSEEIFTVDEREIFRVDIDTVARDAPSASGAALRIKKILAKLPGQAGTILRDILVSVGSDAVKKILVGP